MSGVKEPEAQEPYIAELFVQLAHSEYKHAFL